MFFPTCELKMISWWHANRRQVVCCEMETTHYTPTESRIREMKVKRVLLELGRMAVDFAIIWSTATSTFYTIFANSLNSRILLLLSDILIFAAIKFLFWPGGVWISGVDLGAFWFWGILAGGAFYPKPWFLSKERATWPYTYSLIQ